MPNHVSNALTTTNQQIIAILRECEANGDEDFINALIPVPVELKEIVTGGRTLGDGTKITHWREGPDGECLPITEVEQRRLIKQYGAADWYDWSIREWGTKWGSYSVSYDFTDDKAIVLFDTAWSPPIPFLEKITRIYPQGRTQLAYAEGGNAFFGREVWADGDRVVTECSEDFWDLGKSWDDEGGNDPLDMVTPSCRAHLEAYGLHTGG